MFKVQSIHTTVLHKAVFVTVSIVSNFVYADEQSFIYVSDLVQRQSNINSEQEIWQYQHKVPLAYRDKDGSSQRHYA